MESLLHGYSACSLAPHLNPACFPFPRSMILPHVPPPTSTFRTLAIRRSHSLTWLLVRRHNPPLIHLAALSNGDGGGYHEGEWFAMDAPHAKVFLWKTLKSWGLPVAVGAMVGSLVARQPFVFVMSFSFLIFMVVHKVLETQGEYLNIMAHVLPRYLPLILFTTVKSNASRGLSLLPGAIMACRFGIRSISMRISVFVATIIACLGSIVVKKQGGKSHQRDLPPLNRRQPEGDIARFDTATHRMPLNSVLLDIKECIQKVEGMIQTKQRPLLTLDDIQLKELRETLALLKTLALNLSLRSDGRGTPHLQAALATHDPADMMPLSTVSVKSQESRRDVVMEKTALTNEVEKNQDDSNVQVSKQFAWEEDDRDQKTLDSGAVKNIARQNGSSQDVGLANLSTSADATGQDASSHVPDSGSNGAVLYQEHGPHSANMGGKALPKSESPGKNESNSSMGSNMYPLKFADYWIHQDQNGSTLTSDTPGLIPNQLDAEEEKNKEHSISTGKREGLVTADGQATQREHIFKAPGLYANRRNFWLDEPQQHGESQFGSTGQVSAGESIRSGVLTRELKDGFGNSAEQEGISGRETGAKRPKPTGKGEVTLDAEGHADGSMMPRESLHADLESDGKPIGSKNDENVSRKQVPHSYTDLEGERADLEETRQSKVANKTISNGSVKRQSSSQQNVSGNRQNADKQEGSVSLLDPTKELSFMREDPDMPALKGFSRRRNDEEFQGLMNEGENLFRNGKAGLSGMIEVGEAETMLYKAADLFASAAAMDPSSIDAIGFWGNTLLVHGELKLKLSGELRFMISSPDVISSYQIRRSRVTETREKSKRAAIEQVLQAVCEECEELLIQAGRKYRMALSINNSDIRALYNWGLALCFRAQLISGGGGQNAAEAADRIYLAAIDKFEAMMGISRRYAPGAMLNWGLALRDRSRLRPMSSPDRIDLLQQAKQLFQDALSLHPDDTQIRGAFATCSVELKELQERKDLQSKRSPRSIFGN